MTGIQLAQINIAHMKGALEDPVMAGFVAQLDEINAIADRSPGFVWRLQTTEGNATYLRPFDDERIIVNMSVWESIEHLRAYVYRGAHADALRRRREWFDKLGRMELAMWWIPAGHIPSVDEGKKRLEALERLGPTPFAFTFKQTFPPDPAVIAATDWSAFEPCTMADIV
jgi:uncharacterized protein DUF3291